MTFDLQKASLLRRVSAWILDAILFCVFAVGGMWMVGDIIHYDAEIDALNAHYESYEQKFDISFDYEWEEAYQAMTDQEKEAYVAVVEDAYAAMQADEEVMACFTRTVNMILLMTSLGILLGKLVMELVIPMLLKNGQTVGKKIFGLAVIRTNGVRIGNVSLFIRTLLGKYTIETMLPVYVIIMINTGVLGILGLGLLAMLAVIQLVMVFGSANRCLIHDKLADTVVVDLASQMIFDSQEELLEYQTRIAAEKAEKQAY